MIDLLWLADFYEGIAGFIEVRGFWHDPATGVRPDKEQPRGRPFLRWCSSAEETADVVFDQDTSEDGWNLYTGMASRRERSPGGKADLAQMRALWVDLDFLQPDAGGAFDVALAAWPQFAPAPSYVVDSGGGRHCYWLFEEPVPVDSEKRIEWLECALKGLQLKWRAAEWEADPKVVDVARIMRVPGTRNWPDVKKRAKGRSGVAECAVLERGGHLYQPRDFEALHAIGRAARAEARGTGTPAVGATTELPERVRAVLESSPRVRQLYLHDPNALPRNRKDPQDVSGSVFDWHLMSELARHATLTKAEIIAACQQARIRAGEDAAKAKRADYWERTWKGVAAKRRAAEVEPSGDAASTLRALVRNPAAGRAGPITPVALTATVDPTHRYPSGIDFIDSSMGGLYGLTAVGGAKGVGKSTFLLNAALTTALEPDWAVAYFDSENAGNVWNRRVLHWFGQPLDVVRERLRRLDRHWIDSGVTLGDLQEWICALISPETKHLLVVVDSLNTFLDKATVAGDVGYFPLYKQALLWMQDVRVATEGRVGFLMASELALKGNMLGGKIDFTLDVEIRVQEEKSGDLSVFVEKTRETKRPEVQRMQRGEDFRLRPADAPNPFRIDATPMTDAAGEPWWWDK